MNDLSTEQTEHYEYLRKIKDSISGQYLARPGIRGVGVGFKEVGGQPTDELAVRFYVRKKQDVSEAERVPPSIQGASTDVIEFDFHLGAGRARVKSRLPDTVRVGIPELDPEKYDPLVGGISVGPSRDMQDFYLVGTLGLMVTDANDGGKMRMLSNYHVLCGGDGNAQKGDVICQPSRVDRTLQYCSNCAKLERWFLGNVQISGSMYGVDAAIASLTHRDSDLRQIATIINRVTGAGEAKMNMAVFKRGRSTERTDGVVVDIGLDCSENFGYPYGIVTLKNQVLINPNHRNLDFLQDGDSGSVLVDNVTYRVVGLCWSSSNSSAGVASPILAVMQALQIGI